MSRKNVRISVVIVTKNRSKDLRECLVSLQSQLQKTDELLVINNNSTDETEQVVRAFAQTVPSVVRIIKEKRHGYPVIYNRGLKEAKNQWIAFIDDDCVADPHWLKNCKTEVARHPTVVAIAGLCNTYHTKNIYSLTTFLLNYHWKENGTLRGRVINPEVLDNKNVLYDRTFLNKHNIRYDERRVKFYSGSSEDCDIAMQIYSHQGKAWYSKKIIVSHKDPQTFTYHFRKFMKAFQGYQVYRKQWDLPPENHKPTKRMRNLMTEFATKNKLNFFQTIGFYLVMTVTLCIEKLLLFRTSFIQRQSVSVKSL